MDEERTCIQALVRCLPEIAIRRAETITTGWDSLVLEINGDWIFRFPRRPEIEAGHEKEIALLPELAQMVSLPIPRFEYVFRRDDKCPQPFVGYRKIPGVPLSLTRLSPTQIAQAASQIGRFIGQVQRFPQERATQLGVTGGSPSAWREEYARLYAQVREQIVPLLKPATQASLKNLCEEYLDEPQHVRFSPVLLHRDLTSDHILSDPETGMLTGIIDWEDASIGDPAFDFTGLLYDYGREFTAQALSAYPGQADGRFWPRIRFYAAIIPCHEILYGLSTGAERHVQGGIQALHQALLTYVLDTPRP